jgi:hypothetical protein
MAGTPVGTPRKLGLSWHYDIEYWFTCPSTIRSVGEQMHCWHVSRGRRPSTPQEVMPLPLAFGFSEL